MFERLLRILNHIGHPRVMLVGDFMLDHYLLGNIDRISPEAPVVVLNVCGREERPGGAGSVAMHLATLKVPTKCVGVLGDDATGDKLRGMLNELEEVEVSGLISVKDRPTTSKQRIIGLAQHRHRQQLMRIDEESTGDINSDTQQRLLNYVTAELKDCDVVCLEDYNKGVLSEEFSPKVIAAAKQANKKVIVDPASTTNYQRYRGVWLIKPNRRELSLATSIEVKDESTAAQAARQLSEKYDIENVVVTLDMQGAYVFSRNPDVKSELVPTRARSVYDVTGAGDMVLAMLGLIIGGAQKSQDTPTLSEAVRLANVAGGLEVERFGSVGISRDEIVTDLLRENRSEKGKIRDHQSLLREVQSYKQQGMKVVFTNGCFDLLHPGHIKLLSFAREQGDVLVVAINSDRSVRQLKGESRPILKEQDRAALIAALEAVDYVTVFDEETPIKLIEMLTPDVLIKGTDWQGAVVGQEWVEDHGGEVVLVPLSKGRSTTNIIEQVIKKTSGQILEKE